MNILSKMFILPISTICDLNIDYIKNVNGETESGQRISPDNHSIEEDTNKPKMRIAKHKSLQY